MFKSVVLIDVLKDNISFFGTLDSIVVNPSPVAPKYLQYAIYEKFSIVTVQRQKADLKSKPSGISDLDYKSVTNHYTGKRHLIHLHWVELYVSSVIV